MSRWPVAVEWLVEKAKAEHFIHWQDQMAGGPMSTETEFFRRLYKCSACHASDGNTPGEACFVTNIEPRMKEASLIIK